MDSNKIKAILVLVLSLFIAVYLGITAATAQGETVMWVLGTAGLIVCLLLGRKIWLLLPLGTTLGLVLPLPGHFDTEIIAQGIVIGFCTLMFLMRRLPIKFQFGELEVWSLILIGFILQVYFRHPVGLNIFGTDSIGARDYAEVGITIISALIIRSLIIHPSELRWWVRLTMIGSLINFGIGMVARFAPISISRYLAASFSTDVDLRGGSQDTALIGSEQATRATFLRTISRNLALWISSKRSPLLACFHPLWLPLIGLTILMAAFSGYRSHFGLVGITFMIGVFYWNGLKGLILSSAAGLLGLTLLVLINSVTPLPANLQRAFSFLPGDWGEKYTQDAETSTEWRIEMWKEALFTDRYIQNKWLGDGLGMTREQMNRILAIKAEIDMGINRMGTTGFDNSRETLMISGSYHSGPVHTVRTIGYIGLFFLVLAMARVAIYAHQLIKRAKGTEWFGTVLFICLPFVAAPFYWIFIFGTFAGGASGVFMGIALIRLIQNNLPLPAR